jgi:hypothetical protein
MYTKTNGRCKSLRILHLLVFIALGIWSQTALTYALSSSEILSNKDFFSQYKISDFDKNMHSLIKDCYYSKGKDCIERLSKAVEDNKFKPYLNLLKAMFFKSFSNQEEGFLFLNKVKSKLDSGDLKKIIANKGAKDWLEKNFKALSSEIETLVFERPNVLCSLSDNKEFVIKQLEKLSKSPERFSLNFSKHPCDLDTFVYLKDLKKEKDRLSEGKYFGDFKYEKLQRKAALRIYKSAKRKKGQAFWSSVFKSNAYTQELILKNVFYRREYTKLASLKKSQFKKMTPEASMYVAKSYLYMGEDDKLESLTDALDFTQSEWSEEILLALAVSQIKKEKFTQAKKTLEKLLKYHVNLRLSGLYWMWVLNKKLGLDIENREIVKQIEKQYSFTYYGLRILSLEKGSDYLKKFLEKKEVSVSRLSLKNSEVKKFLNYHSGGFRELFSLYFNSVKERMKPEELALFAMILERMGSRLHAIKTLEEAWELDESLRVQPFFSVSYPYPFEEQVKQSVTKLRHVTEPLVLAIARQESAFNPKAQSGSGAKGLMQVISLTGREVAKSLRLKNYRGSRSLFDPAINLKIGAKYLDRLTASSKGYLPYALASYNAGPGNLYRWSSLRPGVQDLRKGLNHEAYTPIEELWVEELPWSETRFYVKAVLRNLGLYRLLLNENAAFSCEFYWMCGENEKKL